DHLERDEEVLRGRHYLVVVRDHLDATHPHPVPAFESEEMGLDSQVLDDLEPMGGGAAERLSLVRHLRGDDLVEDANLVCEEELEPPGRAPLAPLPLPLPKDPTRPAPPGKVDPSS